MYGIYIYIYGVCTGGAVQRGCYGYLSWRWILLSLSPHPNSLQFGIDQPYRLKSNIRSNITPAVNKLLARQV